MALSIIKREEPLRWGSFFILFLSLALALSLSGVLLSLQGKPALQGLWMLLKGGFGSFYALEDSLIKAIPLFLCSLGVALCFRMQIWNIGAEGQYAFGAIGGTWFVLSFPDLPMVFMLPGMLVCACVAGALFAFIPAILKLRFGMNEIISTLMLNYIAIEFLDLLLNGPWKAPDSFGYPISMTFPDAAIIPAFFGRVHYGFVFCFVLAVGLAFFLQRTRVGFEVMASGANLRAALYARMPYAGLVLLMMCACGALAGLAGIVETSATVNRLQGAVMAGYGYTAIVVAWLARLQISRIAFFAFFLAGLHVGVDVLKTDLQVPAAFAQMIEGLILVTVLAGQFFTSYSFSAKKTVRVSESEQNVSSGDAI